MVVVDCLSIIIPAKNESQGLSLILPEIKRLYPQAEIIVVDDASTDNTASVASSLGASVVTHPYSKGSGNQDWFTSSFWRCDCVHGC
jgi:glycosyltransferase involved in cell wall biosynthesis